MRVWLVTVGEPLPLPNATQRRWRTGLLAAELMRRGHDVVWWTSTLNHFDKTRHFPDARAVQGTDGSELRFLHGRPYARNVSIQRVINHVQIARQFAKWARQDAFTPDVIVSSFPTIELSAEAVAYGEERKVPVVVDIRDLWPDIFVDVMPTSLRWAMRIVLAPLFRQAADLLARATAIVGVSQGYVDWGLRTGRRAASKLDRPFPLAYEPTPVTDAARASVRTKLASLGDLKARQIVLFAGSFGRTYDLDTAIDAARLTVADPRIAYVFCGGGDRADEWRAKAAGLPNVVFPGWLTAPELAAAMEMAWVGLAAYGVGAPQSISNKVIEYMSAGLPVISSLQGEAKALLSNLNCGLTYEPGEPQSLASVLTRCLALPDSGQSMGHAGAAYFEEKFAAGGVFAEMADFLESLATTVRAPGRPPASPRSEPMESEQC